MSKKISDLANELLIATNGDAKIAIEAIKEAATTKNEKPKITYGPVLVHLDNVTKKYKVGSHKIDALKGVSLEIKEGEFVALTGASGSGKSTLLQLMGGLDKPTTGIINVNNQNISKLSDRALSRFRNKTIGFVFQFFYLQPFLNLSTNVEVPAMFARQKPKDRHTQSAAMVESVDLKDRLSHLPRELSGGQMQRAAIARALMNKPKLILADEPTGNLDSANARAIFELFENVRSNHNTTIVVVTHDKGLASMADRTIELRDGEIL